MNKVLIKITGKDVVRFIKNLIRMNISFYDINYIGKSVYIKIDKPDYERVRKIKTLYEIEIIRYYGLLRIKYFFKEYRIILISLVISFFLFLFLTHIIFSVEVKTNNIELEKKIINELDEYGIKRYNLVINYKKQERIKKEIINKLRNEIEWLEIKRIGTKYEILLEERLINDDDTDNKPRNIIAKKNAVITKINAISGEVIGKVDSYVKKGDILISGVIHKKEDKVGETKAIGKVLGEVWYNVTVLLPYHYFNETKTNNKDLFLSIKFLNKEIELFSKKYKSSNKEGIYEITNSFLPIGISLKKQEETIKEDYVYTYYNIIFNASKIARDKLYDKLGKNIEIIYEKCLKLDEENSKIKVVMFYKVIEDITDYGDIVSESEEIR